MFVIKPIYDFVIDYFAYFLGLFGLLCLLIGCVYSRTKLLSNIRQEKRSRVLSILYIVSLLLVALLTISFAVIAKIGYYENHHATHIGLNPYSSLKAMQGFMVGVDLICLLVLINETRLFLVYRRKKKGGDK